MRLLRALSVRWRLLMDQLTIHVAERWIVTAIGLGVMVWRVIIYGYLGLMYFSGLYLLYLAVQFNTPLGLPDPDEDDFGHGTQSQFRVEGSGDRPILRSITEFTFWKQTTVIVATSIICTYFGLFLIPVYWPFLLLYFLALIYAAVRKHRMHMQKYSYRLCDFERKPVLHYDLS